MVNGFTLITRFSTVTPLTILYFDYLLTLGQEVELYWNSRLSWPSALFFANRYAALLGYIPIAIEIYGPLTSSGCSALAIFYVALGFLLQSFTAFLLTFRLYALYDRHRLFLIVFVLLTIALIPLACWSVMGGPSHPSIPITGPHLSGCVFAESTRFGAPKTSLAWVVLLAYETLAFGLVLYKTFTFAYRTPMRPITLPILLLRDGAMYYAAMTLCGVTNIIALNSSPPEMKDAFTTGSIILSTVLTSRMMLNLRSPDLLHVPHRQGDSVPTRASLENSDQTHRTLEDSPTVSTQAVITFDRFATLGAVA